MKYWRRQLPHFERRRPAELVVYEPIIRLVSPQHSQVHMNLGLLQGRGQFCRRGVPGFAAVQLTAAVDGNTQPLLPKLLTLLGMTLETLNHSP